MRAWRIIALGAVIGIVLPVTGARAQTAPAPPSEAEAYAAQVQLGESQVAAVGHADATAGGAQDTAHAGALEIGPEPPPSEQFGGTQEGPGASSGAFIDTAGTPLDALLRLAVTPWSAEVTHDGTGRHSRAHASLLELMLAPGGTKVVELRVLQGDAAADYLATKSTSRSSTDGAVVILGDPSDPERSLVIHILHSEANSESGSKTYLIDINGTSLVSSEDDLGGAVAQICGAINIPGLLKLLCVSASGGLAEFLQATLGDGAAQGGLVHLFLASTAGGGTGGGGGDAPVTVLGGEVAAPPAVDSARGALPATGMGIAGTAAAFAVIAVGMLAARYRRLHTGFVRTGA